ncbi:MAG: hypothetical protein K6L80_06650 [Agarilytica sp.]
MMLTSVTRFVSESSHIQRAVETLKSRHSCGQKSFAVVLLFIVMSVLMGTVAWSSAVVMLSGEEDVVPSPFVSFDLYDAQAFCGAQMEARLGETLLRYYVDEHSSRLDKGKGIYRVYLKADVGDLAKYDVINVHCFVDQWAADLNYYRQFNPSVKMVKSSDIKFF